VQICSKKLANFLTTLRGDSSAMTQELDEILRLANWLEGRYQRGHESDPQGKQLAELSCLIKLSFFYSAALIDPQDALALMKSMHLLPLTKDELQGCVNSFSTLPEQVRAVMPDVITALMKVLVNLFKDPAASQQQKSYYQSCSNVLLMYMAQINLRFPAHINTKFLQLQSQLN
jgi:hypothetical protein